LNRSSDFEVFEGYLKDSITGPPGSGNGPYPQSTDRNLVLSVAQILWDRTDPNGHIQHIQSDPYPGSASMTLTPVKTMLYQVAYGDHQVAPVTVEIAARSVNAAAGSDIMFIHTPTLDPGK